MFWSFSIPFTRYVLGVHSLDQILFGVTLGIWGGLTCHFIIRDHLINYIEESFRHQGINESSFGEAQRNQDVSNTKINHGDNSMETH